MTLGWPKMEDPTEYEVIVAKLSDDLNIAIRHYSTVSLFMKKKHDLGVWVGIEMEPEPPGFERLAALLLRVRK